MYADDLILLLMLVTHMRQMTLKKLRSQHPVIKYGIERQSGEDLSTKFNKMSKYKILLDLIISVVPLPLLFLKVLSKQVWFYSFYMYYCNFMEISDSFKSRPLPPVGVGPYFYPLLG